VAQWPDAATPLRGLALLGCWRRPLAWALRKRPAPADAGRLRPDQIITRERKDDRANGGRSSGGVNPETPSVLRPASRLALPLATAGRTAGSRLPTRYSVACRGEAAGRACQARRLGLLAAADTQLGLPWRGRPSPPVSPERQLGSRELSWRLEAY
jgi:hypothetical protein